MGRGGPVDGSDETTTGDEIKGTNKVGESIRNVSVTYTVVCNIKCNYYFFFFSGTKRKKSPI